MSLPPPSSFNHNSTATSGKQITANATPTQAPKSNTVVQSRSKSSVGNSDSLQIPTLKDTLKSVPLPGLDLLPPRVHTPGNEPQAESDQRKANAELERTIDDLLGWLAIVDEGLTDILGKSSSRDRLSECLSENRLRKSSSKKRLSKFSEENRLSIIFESPDEE